MLSNFTELYIKKNEVDPVFAYSLYASNDKTTILVGNFTYRNAQEELKYLMGHIHNKGYVRLSHYNDEEIF